MATKKQAGNRNRKQGSQQDWQGHGENYREGYDDNFRSFDNERSRGRYSREQENYSRGYRGDDFENYSYGPRGGNYDWQERSDRRYGGEQRNMNRQPGYAGESRGYRGNGANDSYGYNRQYDSGGGYGSGMYREDDWNYRNRENYGSGRYGDEGRYWEGYGRENSASYDRNEDRSPRMFEEDRGYNRADYNNMYRGRSGSYPEGNRAEGMHGHGRRSEYGEDEMHGRERSGSENAPGRHRVVGRGMYGNAPSARYGSYGGDTMHGNMGGGTWQGSNEYQVGGGAGYQPGGNYDYYSGSPEPWDEDRPPGRKFSGTNGGSENRGGRITAKSSSKKSIASRKEGAQSKTGKTTLPAKRNNTGNNKKANGKNSAI